MTTEKFNFQFPCGVTFKEVEDGKITCGKCGQQCTRILTHLSKNKECSANLNISSLKISLNRFKNQQRYKRHIEKSKAKKVPTEKLLAEYLSIS